MKIKNMTLSTLLIALLSACGSSGGSGSGASYEQNHFNIDFNGLTYSEFSKKHVANPMTHIIINGKTYELPTRTDFVEFPADDLDISISRYNHMIIGGYGKISNQDFVEHSFIQGNITPADKMPTSGIFIYETKDKEMEWSVVNSKTDYYDYFDGKGTFRVDFGEKKLTGSAYGFTSLGNRKDIEFSADIKGNQFEGTKNDFTLKGGFFGPNAEEIGGFFESLDKKSAGVFGATKQ